MCEHEALWVVRECLSGEVVGARSLLSSTANDLGQLLQAVQAAVPVPVAGMATDGQRWLRQAVAQVWPAVPNESCTFTICAKRPTRRSTKSSGEILR